MKCALREFGCFGYETCSDADGCEVAKAISAEREACAKIADDHDTPANDTWREIAAAIRARGETK